MAKASGANEASAEEPQAAEAIPAFELAPESPAEAEPAPIAKLKRAPIAEPVSPEPAPAEHVAETEVEDEVASEPAVTDNGKADLGEAPDESSLEAGRALLDKLGAVDPVGRLTELGRNMGTYSWLNALADGSYLDYLRAMYGKKIHIRLRPNCYWQRDSRQSRSGRSVRGTGGGGPVRWPPWHDVSIW